MFSHLTFWTELCYYKNGWQVVVISAFPALLRPLSDQKRVLLYRILLWSGTKTSDLVCSPCVSYSIVIKHIISPSGSPMQFHRVVLYDRLLRGYPYTIGRVFRESRIDTPPLYRAEVWAALLAVEVSYHIISCFFHWINIYSIQQCLILCGILTCI